MCKQLNGSVLKSLKTKRSGPKLEKNWAGPVFLFGFGPGRAGLGLKFQFLFRAGTGPKFSLLRAGLNQARVIFNYNKFTN